MRPSLILPLGLAAVGLLGLGCSRRASNESATGAHSPAPSEESSAGPVAPASSIAGAVQAEKVPLKTPMAPLEVPTASVSASDTAEATEAWSDAVKSQLAKLAQALQSPPSDPHVLGEVCADSLTITETTSWQVRTASDSAPILVTEIGPADAASPSTVIAKSDACLQQLQRVLALATEDKFPGSATFKLFGLEREADELKTRQRLTTRGRRGELEIRSLVVADAVWTLGSPDAPPKLTALTWSKIVQSALPADPPATFEDMTGRVLAGVEAWNAQLHIGMNTWARRLDRSLKPDFLGYHGIAIGDVNGDNQEDVYLCQPGGLPNLLLVRQPNGALLDVSAKSGVDWLDNTTGALLVDLDNDGDRDLALATHRAFLIMENDGAGHFSLRSRLTDIGLGYSPSASDYDLDGDLDILVLRYGSDSRELGGFPTPHPFYDARNGGANVLLENQGGFRFADVTDARGLGAGNFRFSFAASWEDYDNDGDSDVYIANDFGPNQLFRNDRGQFVDVSATSGAEDWGFGMSATWGDPNRDGHMDLYVCNMFSGAGNQVVPQTSFNPSMNAETRGKYLKMVRGNSLLQNTADGRFSDITDPMAEGFGKWAWGAKFGDFNNDGWEDLYVANGYISQPDKGDL